MVDLERRKVSYFFNLIERGPIARQETGAKSTAALCISPAQLQIAAPRSVMAHAMGHCRRIQFIMTGAFSVLKPYRGVALKPCRRRRCLRSGPGSPGRVTRSLRGPRVPTFSIGTRPTEPAP